MKRHRMMADDVTKELESIHAFLFRFRRVAQQFEVSKQLLRANISTFLDRFRTERRQGLDEAQAKWQELNAPHFNIFHVLNIQRHEMKLHSRILTDLLSPSGLHDHNFKFLDAFMDAVCKIPLYRAALIGLREWYRCNNSKPADWQVQSEITAPRYGRFDIVLSCHRNSGFLMVIENKVDAAEGDNQLIRYDKWIEKQRPNYAHRYLVFLTPDGRLPSTNIKHTTCLCLSYREHIHECLRCAARAVEAPKLSHILEQYILIIKEL